MNSIQRACYTALTTLILAGVSFSQDARADSKTDQQDFAKIAFDEAAQHVLNGEYEQALEAFQRSQKLRSNPDALFNIAMCYKALSRYRDAYHGFQKYLKISLATGHSSRYRARAEHAMDELLRHVSQIHISENVPIDRIRIDDEVIHELPHSRTIVVDAGNHTIGIEAAGFQPFKSEINCPAGMLVDLAVNMVPEKATLIVQCEDDNATVFVDDEKTGRCDSQISLSPGARAIRVEAGDKQPFSSSVDVQAGQTIRMTAALEDRQAGLDSNNLQLADKVYRETRLAKIRRITGVVALSAGAAGLATGVVLTFAANSEYQETEKWRPEAQAGNLEALSKFNKADQNFVSYRNGMVAAIATGAALAATGAALLIIDVIKKKNTQKSSRFSAVASGFRVKF